MHILRLEIRLLDSLWTEWNGSEGTKIKNFGNISVKDATVFNF